MQLIAGEAQLSALAERCNVGDVIIGVGEDRAGSVVGYVARVCDFQQEIVTYRHPDPSRTQTTFACVFTGRVPESCSVKSDQATALTLG